MLRFCKFLFLLLTVSASVFTVPAEASCIYNKTNSELTTYLRATKDYVFGQDTYSVKPGERKCFTDLGGEWHARVPNGGGSCRAGGIESHGWVKVYGSKNAIRCTINDTKMTNDELRTQATLEGGNRWAQAPGKAIDVGVGKNGSVFVVGISDNPLFRFNFGSMNWDRIDAAGTGITRVDVDKDGNPWWVTRDHKIFTLDMESGKKTQLPGEAWDIGVGADPEGKAVVYIVSTQEAPGGYVILRLDSKRRGWQETGGNGTHIDVAQAGQAFPVMSNSNHDVFLSKVHPDDPEGIAWYFIKRKGRDVAVGDGRRQVSSTAPWEAAQVAYVGMNDSPMRRVGSGLVDQEAGWERLAGRPVSISTSNPIVDVPGLWMTDINNNIFYWRHQ